jgi:hypothetical protein
VLNGYQCDFAGSQRHTCNGSGAGVHAVNNLIDPSGRRTKSMRQLIECGYVAVLNPNDTEGR